MRVITTSFLTSFIILLVAFAVGGFGLADVDGSLILHFDQYRNIVLGSQLDVFMMIIFGVGLVAINMALAKVFAPREHFIAVLLSMSSVFLSLLILISVFAIIANN